MNRLPEGNEALSCGSLSYLSKVPACGANNKMSYSGGVHSMEGTGAVSKNSILHNRNYIHIEGSFENLRCILILDSKW